MTQDAAYYAKRSSERFESGDIEGGDADLNRAIELDPDNVEYRWERGRFRYNAEEYALMVEDISKIIEVSSDLDDLQEAYILLSIAYDALGQDQELISGFGLANQSWWGCQLLRLACKPSTQSRRQRRGD
jgi:tetratricopeptide (TPR) repeat protein